jgi:hypothetical protein
MSRPAGARRWLLVALVASALPAAPVAALEGDQFYAWGRPIADSTDAINAKIRVEIDGVLAGVNRHGSWRTMSCHAVVKRIVPRFRDFMFHDIEIWATKSPLVDRVPATSEEERAFRRESIYRNTNLLDLGTKVPPSPTIEVNGVRIGTDKLSHFFSEGWMYYKWYRAHRRHGMPVEEAERRAILRGLVWERTILGSLASGIMSRADLEANYEGMRYLAGLCEGDAPGLQRTPEGWLQARPLDLRDHVGPEWDESWQPSIFGKSRWKKVLPALVQYCPMLADESVKRQREAYAARERTTPTERQIDRLVEAGKLADPRMFSVEAVCNGSSQPWARVGGARVTPRAP